jgi:hypothetical protein
VIEKRSTASLAVLFAISIFGCTTTRVVEGDYDTEISLSPKHIDEVLIRSVDEEFTSHFFLLGLIASQET